MNYAHDIDDESMGIANGDKRGMLYIEGRPKKKSGDENKRKSTHKKEMKEPFDERLEQTS